MLVAALVPLPSILRGALAASPPPLPSQDPFYTYRGPTPLADLRPGTVLARRSVDIALGPRSTPVTAEQLLYRTTDQVGDPSATVTTVVAPPTGSLQPKVVEYLSFYDGLGSQCDPSYTLRGGQPDSTTEQQAEEEELLISWYVSQGFTVTIPDFEGTGLHWMAGRESGYGTLDAARATESYLGAPATTPVGLSGYSGGAVAADWASEMAPTYAPELRIVGVAEGGIPVNYLHMFQYIDGTAVYSAAIPGILLGLARAYHFDLSSYLSSYGEQVVAAESNVCIDSVFSKYPGLTVQSLLNPQHPDFFSDPVLAPMFAAQQMGMVGTPPAEPLFMAVGNSDGRGDGVMNAADVQSLARRYCQAGVPVEFQEYTGASHETAGAYFEPQTGTFLQDRLNGLPFVGNCSQIK